MDQKIKIPGFVSFILSPAGRITRIAVGATMIGLGYRRKSRAGYMIAALGLLPLSAGAFDICVLGPLLGGYFNGDKTRLALHQQRGSEEFGIRSRTFLNA